MLPVEGIFERKTVISEDKRYKFENEIDLRIRKRSQGRKSVLASKETIGVWYAVIHIHNVDGKKTIVRRRKR